QVWSNGKGRGEETFARITSDVDMVPARDRVFFSPGSVNHGGVQQGKVIELKYSSREVLFEASIIPPQSAWEITFHRTERLHLFPQ
ncbi:MAG: aryl-sulfate sulfotransferase, partial [Saprospiraceae bacterium]|nr:aryl-sulfate sulfotransferase [Saprospiraceae bacterium]